MYAQLRKKLCKANFNLQQLKIKFSLDLRVKYMHSIKGKWKLLVVVVRCQKLL